MAIEAMKVLSKEYAIFVVLSSFNSVFIEKLKDFNNIIVYKIDYYSNRLQIIKNFFSFKCKSELWKFAKQINPDLCVAVQGTIDTSFLMLNICKKNNIKCVSYIPMAHDLKKTSKHKFIGLVKDIIRVYYYLVPDIFITINEVIAEQIFTKSNNKNIFVVRNGIHFDNYTRYNKKACRKKHEIPEDAYVMGYIGRIELWHKGLDYYISFLYKYADRYPNIIFLFVGSGSKKAENDLRKIVSLKKNIKHIPWTNNVSEIYSLIDCYIIPSRFEGCPITMIEALFFDVPVIASNIPEVACFLPNHNLFRIKDYNQMNNKIDAALNGKLEKPDIDFSDFSITTFKQGVSQSIMSILNANIL
jgi:glycosyltransferase involved in cell wall biosynthesis